MKTLVVVLALAACALAQGPGNLNSYAEVKDRLLSGGEAQINADSVRCDATNLDGPLLVSMPLRHWQIIVPDDGPESIRADDYYIGTPSTDEVTLILRRLVLQDDDTVVVTLTSTLNGTEAITLNCQLGEGAIAHPILPGNDLEDIDEYNEVKSLLLSGSHVEAIGDLGQCSNAAEQLPPGINYIVGYLIQLFSVVNDGTDDEFLSINDVAVIAVSDDQEAISTEQLLLLPDGSVSVTIAVLSTDDLSQLATITLDCQLGSAIRFTVHERDQENTLVTYEAVKESTISGHDMELIVFLEFCELLEGENVDWTGSIASARYDEFQLFPAGSVAGNELEYIAFSTYSFSVEGTLFVGIARVSEDNVVTLESFDVTPSSDSESNYHVLSCPLQDAALFHAVGRNRPPVGSYQELIQDVVQRGQTFEIEINYADCNTGELQFDSIYGGIIWETYINPAPDTGFFFGSVFAVVQQNLTGTPAPAWDASDLLIFPDDTVWVTPRLYDYATGANLFPDAPEEPIVCTLAAGGPGADGGVRLFRYP